MSESKWFHRGREARSLGELRILNDGRISSKNRQEFYHGWDHEDRMRSQNHTPEEIAEFQAGIAAIRAALKNP